MNIKPSTFRVFKQYLSSDTALSCTLYATLHMIVYNNLVKGTEKMTAEGIKRLNLKLKAMGIIGPVGSDMYTVMKGVYDEMAKNCSWWARRKHPYVLNYVDAKKEMDNGNCVVAIIGNSSEIMLDHADGKFDGVIQDHNWSIGSHAVIVALENGKYICYDSFSTIGTYEIVNFVERIPEQIYPRFYIIK